MYLVAAREGNSPSLEAANKFLAGDVPFRIADDAPCHDEGEDPRTTAIGQLRESVEKSHHRIPAVLGEGLASSLEPPRRRLSHP